MNKLALKLTLIDIAMYVFSVIIGTTIMVGGFTLSYLIHPFVGYGYCWSDNGSIDCERYIPYIPTQ